MITRPLLCSLKLLALGLADPAMGGGHDWMTGLDGDLSLSQLSIPGTHDSAARFEPVHGTAACQSMTLAEQLKVGVRFLDIRCRHMNDGFRVHHGVVDQRLGFAEVIEDVLAFLDANAGETVVMSIKSEHTTVGTTRSFEDTFDSYVSKHSDRWWLASGVPTLAQARGKIVLFRRFGAKAVPKGIDASKWPNNTTFEKRGVMKVQDRYVVPSNIDKWKAIEELLNEARSGGPDMLYVNFASGYRSGMLGIPSIPTVSNDINPRLEAFFSTNRNGRFGVILMDFVNRKRAELIYETNASLP